MALKKRASFWKGRAVLVTGGAGFIGYALATALAERGARVVVLDIKPSLPPFLLGSSDVRKKISFVRGSVTSKRTVDRILRSLKIKTVFHLAAEAIVGRAAQRPARALETNARGTWVFLESVRHAPHVQEIIVASSDKAYGAHEKLPYREDAALRGLNPYDCSKSCTDLIAQMYARSFGLPIAILRCGNVYGPGDTNFTRLIPDAFRSAAKKRVLDIRSDGTFRRDWIYIDDIVDSYLMLGEKLRRRKLGGEAFNIGNNRPLRVLDVLKAISRVAPELKYMIRNTARGEIHDQFLDARKAHRVLGWRARVGMRDGSARTALWYRNYFVRNNLPT